MEGFSYKPYIGMEWDMNILDKKQMSEEDIKLNFITPALLQRGWKDKITMETKVKFTDGKINLKGNVETREAPKKADYVLYINANNPIAIWHAYSAFASHEVYIFSIEHGQEQAIVDLYNYKTTNEIISALQSLIVSSAIAVIVLVSLLKKADRSVDNNACSLDQ